MSSAFQFINVPTGVWIDERGKVVRPGEPAWTTSRTSTYGGKELVTEGQEYVAAIRDWATNGDRSAYALSDDAFAARVKRRSDDPSSDPAKDGPPASVDEWVTAFKVKRAQIADQRCPL